MLKQINIHIQHSTYFLFQKSHRTFVRVHFTLGMPLINFYLLQPTNKKKTPISKKKEWVHSRKINPSLDDCAHFNTLRHTHTLLRTIPRTYIHKISRVYALHIMHLTAQRAQDQLKAGTIPQTHSTRHARAPQAINQTI